MTTLRGGGNLGSFERTQFNRRYTRYLYGKGDVSTVHLVGQFGDSITARMVDLSIGGARIHIKGFKVFQGEKLEVKIAFPGRSASKSLSAKIVWIKNAFIGFAEILCVGIQFTELDTRIRRDLSLVFRALKTTKNAILRKRLIPARPNNRSEEWLILGVIIIVCLAIYPNLDKLKNPHLNLNNSRSPASISNFKEKTLLDQFWKIIYKYTSVENNK